MAQAQTAPPVAAGSGEGGGRMRVRSPATGRPLGSVPLTEPAQVGAEVQAALEVQPLWALLRVADRARYVRRMAQAVIDEMEEIVAAIAAEQGRPAAEVASLEVLPAIDALIWTAQAGPRVLAGARVPAHRSLMPFARAVVAQEPFGVVAVIGAGSAPLAQPLAQIGAALLAGNGVIFKPAPRACLAGERIASVVRRAGLPEGLARVCHGGPQTGIALASAPVGSVLFTGSPGVGRRLAAECVTRGVEVSLELGGKDAMLVLADAEIGGAVAGALWAANAAAGQARGAVERIYVAAEVHDRFRERLVAGAAAMRLGDPAQDPRVQVGPLASRRRLERVERMVGEAVQGGAELCCGGPLSQPPAGCSGAFYAPAVLSVPTGLAPQLRLMREPIGGPVVALIAVESVAEAIELANAGALGLGASVWSADRHGARRVARELQAGMVWMNDHLPAPMVTAGPWGALGGGSFGRTLGESGLRACAREKLITWQPPGVRGLWWGPYSERMRRAAEAAARLRSARDRDRSRAWRTGALALARTGARALARR